MTVVTDNCCGQSLIGRTKTWSRKRYWRSSAGFAISRTTHCASSWPHSATEHGRKRQPASLHPGGWLRAIGEQWGQPGRPNHSAVPVVDTESSKSDAVGHASEEERAGPKPEAKTGRQLGCHPVGVSRRTAAVDRSCCADLYCNTRIRLSGQKISIALPMIRSWCSGPQAWLSLLSFRLSPITK
jgi:hypothetical protein